MSTINTAVGSAPALIFNPGAVTTMIVTNTGSTAVYLGQASVTAVTGFPLAPTQTLHLPNVTQAIYAVSGVDVTKSPTSTLSANASLGATALTVASGGTSFTNGMVIAIQDGNNSELVTVGSGSTGTSVVVAATTKAHSTGVTFGQFVSHAGSSVSVVSGT